MTRKRTFAIALCAAAFAVCTMPVSAQEYPVKPVRFVIAFSPGGPSDILTRLVGSKLAEGLGQTFIFDNRAGAGGNLAGEIVAKAPPDGYTLLMGNNSILATNASLYKNMSFDPVKELAPVALLASQPNILVVHPSLPVRNVKDLIALAKAKPGAMNFSSAGSGTTQHLSGELFKLKSGINVVHVPYKGSAPSLTALLGGEVEMTFANIPAISSHVKSGRLRPLASTGLKRAAQMPNVPTMKESGVSGVEVVVWYGVLAPAQTPREIVNTLSAAITKATHSAEMRQRLLDQGAEPVGNTPEEFAKILREEVRRWAEVVKVSGAKAD
jgi:tripartite-type tricarboxylate transporter receptor subunit TctC